MKKLIKLEFNNTTRERKTEDSYSELYSYDKNNGLFEFEIKNDTLTTEQVIALFKFTESNKIWKTTGTVEGNKVKVTFDTSLITQNETVICYLYFDEEQRTSDTFRFKFKVKVSEIDKMSRYEIKERFINNTVIVDRLDVVTKDELKEALKNVGGIATEGLLTEVKAEELYAKKSELPTPYNDSALISRVSALESKQDKDTVYNDTEVKQRLTALENRPSTGGNVQTQDTGWITISENDPLNGNVVKIRRINDVVHVSLSNPDNENTHLQLEVTDEHGAVLANKEIRKGFTPMRTIIVPVTATIENIMSSTEVDTTGQAVFDVKNNRVSLKVYDKTITSGIPTNKYINDFSYFTEDPFPVELQK